MQEIQIQNEQSSCSSVPLGRTHADTQIYMYHNTCPVTPLSLQNTPDTHTHTPTHTHTHHTTTHTHTHVMSDSSSCGPGRCAVDRALHSSFSNGFLLSDAPMSHVGGSSCLALPEQGHGHGNTHTHYQSRGVPLHLYEAFED